MEKRFTEEKYLTGFLKKGLKLFYVTPTEKTYLCLELKDKDATLKVFNHPENYQMFLDLTASEMVVLRIPYQEANWFLRNAEWEDSFNFKTTFCWADHRGRLYCLFNKPDAAVIDKFGFEVIHDMCIFPNHDSTTKSDCFFEWEHFSFSKYQVMDLPLTFVQEK